MTTATNLSGRAGRWSAAHPWRAIGLWVGFLVVALAAGSAVGTVKLTDAQSGSGEAGRASQAISRGFPAHATEQVLISSPDLSTTDPTFVAAISDVVNRVSATGQALDLRSPLDPAVPGQVSRDGHAALVTFDLPGTAQDAAGTVGGVVSAVQAAAAAHPAVRIEQAGDASIAKGLSDTVQRDFRRLERLSIPITLVVLLLAFGALVAAMLPVGLALTAIAAATGLLALASHLSPVSEDANSIMLCIGLAVGVDYSLFYLKREREERAAGRGEEAALLAAAATSGRSVLVSGLTVLIAMAGMFFTGNRVFVAIGQATMIVVATAVLGSLTVLPAVLSLLGDRVDKGRIPLVSRLRHPQGKSRVWRYVVTRSLRHPIVAVLAAGGVLVALALPTLGLHTAMPWATDLPQQLPVIQSYNRIQQAFPGGPTPALVVVEARDVRAPAVQGGIAALQQRALASGAMTEPTYVQVNPNGTMAMVALSLVGNGEDAASAHALGVLRTQVIPATIGTVAGATVNVTGMTAFSRDFNSTLKQRAPLVFGFVLALAFVLLLVSFRSLVIAAKAIVLNLLSVAAAYGVLVLVFQHGWGSALLDYPGTNSIAAWLPLFLFVVLFGLSMDYHVFILSRVREAHEQGHSTESAVEYGITRTAGVVTAAAIVMVCVFLTFATLQQISFKQMGIGLAAAVLLDATIVRGVLLPASMKLLGDWNWYLPRWLNWLPAAATAEVPPPVVTLPPEQRPVEPAEAPTQGSRADEALQPRS